MPREKQTHLKDEAKRPERVSIADQRDMMGVRGLPAGKVGRWVNDTEDRIDKFLRAGYEFVTDANLIVGDRTLSGGTEAGNVISRKVGNGVTAYLMVIDQDLYDYDQGKKEERIRELEENLTRTTGADKLSNRYGGVKVSRLEKDQPSLTDE